MQYIANTKSLHQNVSPINTKIKQKTTIAIKIKHNIDGQIASFGNVAPLYFLWRFARPRCRHRTAHGHVFLLHLYPGQKRVLLPAKEAPEVVPCVRHGLHPPHCRCEVLTGEVPFLVLACFAYLSASRMSGGRASRV